MTVYIGYDPKEEDAYKICKYSIESKTSVINIQPLSLPISILTRPVENRDGKLWCPISQAPMSTEFAVSRFVIPFIESIGWHMFMDCDMLCTVDIKEIFKFLDPKYAIMVVKHKQEKGSNTKMDGQIQTYYNRKNWSSMVLWNCSHEAHKRFTINDLNLWPGRDLHAFKWLKDEEIGELPTEWNYLVGVNDKIEYPKIIHYTLGGPWFKDWGLKYEEDILWLNEYEKLNNEKI